jgi:tetratricopeptide (TPR) repeat protein
MAAKRGWVGVLVLALALGCGDEASERATHLERGDAYVAEEKFPEAIIEYKNVLRIDPNDPAAHYGLALAYLATENARQAFWELQETVRLEPANHEARLRYGQFLLYGKEEDLENAVEQATAIVEAEPERAEAYLLRARARQQLGRRDEALADYEKAVEVKPDSAGALMLLANFHRREDNRAAAEPLYRRLAEVEPGFGSFQALGGFLAQPGDRDPEAEAAYRSGLELAEEGQRIQAIQTLGSFYFHRERFDDAEQLLRQGIEDSGGDLDLIYALARFYHARGNPERADEMVLEATRAHPDEVKPHLILSAYRSRLGDSQGALAAAEAALEVEPGNLAARLRKAELLVEMGFREDDVEKISSGRSIVNAILSKDEADPGALFVKAKIDLADRDPDAAIASLRRALDVRPQWAQAHFVLGSAMFAAGERTEARSELVRALEIDANLIDARRVLTQVHTSMGEHESAVAEGRRVLKERPDAFRTRILVAQSLIRMGQVDEGLAELRSIPMEDRGAEAHYALGRVLLIQGDVEAARQELLLAVEMEPSNDDILGELLKIDASQGRLPEAQERIHAALAEDPDNSSLIRLEGLGLIAAGDAAGAEKSLRRAIELNRNDLEAYQSLVRLLAATGRAQDVLSVYEQALEARPESATLHLIVGTLHEQAGRQALAIEHYEQAARFDPGLGAAKNNLAYLLAEREADLDRALDLAQEAKSLLPNSANAADTLGWVLYKKNIPSAAIPYLKEAESGLPQDDLTVGVVRHHLALAYEANGEPAKARAVIDRALDELEQLLAARRQPGVEPPEPAWAGELRDMRARLDAES